MIYAGAQGATAAEMADAVAREVAQADVLVMAAAVADFRPAAPLAGKIERAQHDEFSLDLVPTTDILGVSARPGLVRVAFAAEAGPQIKRARAKRAAKDVELLVFNDILGEGIGVGSDDNEVTIISARGERYVPRTSKRLCAAAIIDELETTLAAL